MEPHEKSAWTPDTLVHSGRTWLVHYRPAIDMEGGRVQALGYAVSEEMIYDGLGNLATKEFGDYRIFAEMDGVAVASAIHNAVGVRLNSTPFTPEKVWRAMGVG